EGDLEVEQDEQDGDQVVADVELHASVLEGLEAALVGGEFLGVGAMGTKDPAYQQGADAHPDPDEDEQQHRQVVLEIHICPRSVTLPRQAPEPRGRSRMERSASECHLAGGAEDIESLVPTARLELAQLSPLPPQDSVSTNFTTSARPGNRALKTR